MRHNPHLSVSQADLLPLAGVLLLLCARVDLGELEAEGVAEVGMSKRDLPAFGTMLGIPACNYSQRMLTECSSSGDGWRQRGRRLQADHQLQELGKPR
jgi:hypothetical protein